MSSRTTWTRRLAAGSTAVLTMLLAVSLCCSAAAMAMPQHGCCKDRCSMAPVAIPIVAIEPVKQHFDRPMVFPADISDGTEIAAGASSQRIDLDSSSSRLFEPIHTIQLRI